MEFGVLFKILFGFSLLINVVLFAEQCHTYKDYDELVDELDFQDDYIGRLESENARLRAELGRKAG